jgi:hypothetical protein
MDEEITIEHIKGNESDFYSQYFNAKYHGYDRVLQHKIAGAETAHVTIHPGDKPRVRIERTSTYLKQAVANKLSGHNPALSKLVLDFMTEISEAVSNS